MPSDNTAPPSASAPETGNAGPESLARPGETATDDAALQAETALDAADDAEETEAEDEEESVAAELQLEEDPAQPLTVGDTGERPPAYIEPEPPEELPELRGVTDSGEPAEIDPAKLDPDAVKVVHRLRAHG